MKPSKLKRVYLEKNKQLIAYWVLLKVLVDGKKVGPRRRIQGNRSVIRHSCRGVESTCGASQWVEDGHPLAVVDPEGGYTPSHDTRTI